MKQIILNVINSNTGIKEVQLAMRVMSYMDPSQFSNVEFHDVLKKLIDSNEIRVINYSVPSTNYRLKSIYFPKGTMFQFESKS